MAFRLDQKEPFMKGVKRIVREQIDLAFDEMAHRPIDSITVPHQARKRCKKIRALIRLIKIGMKNREIYQQENRRYRDAARKISDIRDAQVMIETYDHLMDSLNPRIDRREFGPIRRQLSQRLESFFSYEAIPCCVFARSPGQYGEGTRKYFQWDETWL